VLFLLAVVLLTRIKFYYREQFGTSPCLAIDHSYQIHPIPSFDNLTALDDVLDEMERVGMYLMYDMRQ
jgi:hypothetical protein